MRSVSRICRCRARAPLTNPRPAANEPSSGPARIDAPLSGINSCVTCRGHRRLCCRSGTRRLSLCCTAAFPDQDTLHFGVSQSAPSFLNLVSRFTLQLSLSEAVSAMDAILPADPPTRVLLFAVSTPKKDGKPTISVSHSPQGLPKKGACVYAVRVTRVRHPSSCAYFRRMLVLIHSCWALFVCLRPLTRHLIQCLVLCVACHHLGQHCRGNLLRLAPARRYTVWADQGISLSPDQVAQAHDSGQWELGEDGCRRRK